MRKEDRIDRRYFWNAVFKIVHNFSWNAAAIEITKIRIRVRTGRGPRFARIRAGDIVVLSNRNVGSTHPFSHKDSLIFMHASASNLGGGQKPY
jgi:hypothetical protein